MNCHSNQQKNASIMRSNLIKIPASLAAENSNGANQLKMIWQSVYSPENSAYCPLGGHREKNV
jgi:hypothetical protein